MPIYHDGKKMKPYRGYRKPVNIYYGDKKVAGWKNSTQTGNYLTFQTTYNDTADVVVKGKTLQKSEWVHKQGLTSQDSTIETITNPLSTYLIPFRCGSGTFDMSISGATNAKWLYNGTMYEVPRLQLTTVADKVVWLLTDGFGGSVTVSNNSVAQPIKLDLADLQGKITYYLSLYGCSNITGSLADLQGKITYYLNLDSCSNITGSLADLQGKITYYLNLYNCSNITGSLADLQGKITYHLSLDSCSNITGSLADLQGKITYYLSLSYCPNITGSLADLQGKITYCLDLSFCSNITGVYTPVGDGVPTFTYLSYTGLSASDMDATLIAYANASKDNGTFVAVGMTRTAASDTAVATLTGRGWAISGITKV
jgi:hypothetical protein